jgi:hypothetical protein
MSYLYKKPTKRSEYPKGESLTSLYGKASIDEVIEVNEVVIPEREHFVKVRVPTLWEEKVEKVDVIGSHITEISYEEHLKNLELMCKMDREFMKRVRLFCEENKEQNFPDVEQPIQHPKPASQHEEGSE